MIMHGLSLLRSWLLEVLEGPRTSVCKALGLLLPADWLLCDRGCSLGARWLQGSLRVLTVVLPCRNCLPQPTESHCRAIAGSQSVAAMKGYGCFHEAGCSDVCSPGRDEHSPASGALSGVPDTWLMLAAQDPVTQLLPSSLLNCSWVAAGDLGCCGSAWQEPLRACVSQSA